MSWITYNSIVRIVGLMSWIKTDNQSATYRCIPENINNQISHVVLKFHAYFSI